MYIYIYISISIYVYIYIYIYVYVVEFCNTAVSSINQSWSMELGGNPTAFLGQKKALSGRA